jgi:DNA topoisomerase-3
MIVFDFAISIRIRRLQIRSASRFGANDAIGCTADKQEGSDLKILVIAEKPDMGRNIAAAIEPKAVNKRTHLEGERYIITWAIGHLIGLAEPDHYDPKYKKWNFQDLPIIPDRFKLLPNPRTKEQLKAIQTLASQCSEIVNACDAGREGQLIFAYIQQHLRLRHPVKRLWISDLTPETIRRGFAELKDAAEYEPLTRAARARSEADWLIGMNGSRAFTTKHNELLSVGRVQTPVLALLYDRQKQIEAFQTAKYYEVEAYFAQRDTVYRGLWQGGRLDDPERAKALAAKVEGKQGKIASYEVKDTKEYPFKLYDLTLLQRDANAKYGFSAKKTLDLAQSLYEKHKVITYPRTNSNYVNEQNIPEMHRALDQLRSGEYAQLAEGADKRLVHKQNKAVCNPAKVEDHHAILPTAKKAGNLAPDERKLYDLIIRRFLSQFYPPAEYKVHTVLTEAENEMFKTTVKQLIRLGWKTIYGDDAAESGKNGAKTSRKKSGAKDAEKDDDTNGREPEEELIDTPFELMPNEHVLCREANAKEKETQPPKPYTEGTLLKAMESAGKQLEDEELRDAMKDSGLGTPATRAAIIERLKKVGYITMQGKRIAITPKGRAAVELIRGAGVELLASPEMTGQWERRLNEIARGKADDAAFMESVKKFTRKIIEQVRMQTRADRAVFAAGEAAAGAPAASRGRSRAAKRSKAETGNIGSASPARRGKSRTAARSEAAAGSPAALEPAAGGTAVPAASAAAKAPARQQAQAHSASAGERATICACPREGCGGRLFLGNKGYGCSNYKAGCGFVIWKSSFGKTLTPSMIKSLAEKGRTGKLKLTASDGSAFEGRLVLKDRNSGQLEIERL